MINWSTVPMAFNDSWSYLEMLGKLVSQVQADHDLILTYEDYGEKVDANTEAINALTENLSDNYYTITQCDEKFATLEYLRDNYYDNEECDEIFATNTWAGQADRRISALEDRVGTRKGVYFFDVMNDTTYSTSGTTTTITVTKPVDEYDAIEMKLNTRLNDGTNSDYWSDSFYCLASASQKYCRHVVMNATGTDYTVTVDLTGTGDTFTVVFDGIKVTGIEGAECVVYLADTPVSPEIKQHYYDMADANGDGNITIEDARMINEFAGELIAQHYSNDLAGWEEWLSDKGIVVLNPVFPDADRDGVVSMADGLLALQYYAHVTGGDWEDTVDNWYLFTTGQTPPPPQ